MTFIVIQSIVVVAGFIMYFISHFKIKSAEKDTLTLMLLASCLHSIGTLLIMRSANIYEAIIAFKIECAGSFFIAYIALMFTTSFCHIKIPKWFSDLLFIIIFIAFMATLLNKRFDLMVTDFDFYIDEPISYLTYTKGFLYPVLLVCEAICVIMNIVILITAAIQKKLKGKTVVLPLLFAIFLPAVISILEFIGIFNKYNPLSLAVMLFCLIIFFTMQKYKLFDVVSSARDNVIDTMDDALIVVDKNMKLLDSNPAAKVLFPDIVMPKGKKAVTVANSFISTLFDTDQTSEFEMNDHYYEKHITNIHNESNEIVGYAALILDITTTRDYVYELINMRQRADMANNAKSDFLANMSHEIRTPMNAITGFAELCIQEKNFTYANEIKKAAKSMLTIINDILDISKIESGKLELVCTNYDTMTAINDVIEIAKVQLAHKSTVHLITEIDPSLPKTLYGDDVRIKQILNNLLSNAVKFTKDGTINLSISELSRNNDNISIRFKVKDTGIGIAKENIKKLFMNFQQLDTKKNREIEGTGLGLSITKSLVEMMNGSITVESVYEEGSTFTVIIQQKIIDSKKISQGTSVNVDTGIRRTIYAPDAHVLIVDDNQVNLDVTAHLLSMYGINADKADSGRQAIRMINSSYYDLVFMDHMMPELDGVDTTKLIRAQGDAYCKQLPIIALTANAVNGAKEMFLKDGLNDFISKPIVLPMLEAVLEKWLPPQLYSYRDINPNEVKKDYDFQDFMLDDIFAEEIPAEKSHGIVIQNVDVDAGLALYRGNVKAYLAVLKTFYETGEAIIQRIEQYSLQRQYKSYTTEVHGLKSAALTIGAVTLSEQAKALEMAGKAEDYSIIEPDTPALLVRYSELLKNIKPYVVSGIDDEASNKPEITTTKLYEKILTALEAFDDLEFKLAAEILSDIVQYSYVDKSVMDIIFGCISDLDNFAYETAESKLKDITDSIFAYRND